MWLRPIPPACAGAALMIVALAVGAGCGDSADPRPARLEGSAPVDGAVVRDDAVEGRGRVRPARARVIVSGREETGGGGGCAAAVKRRLPAGSSRRACRCTRDPT